MHSLQRRFPIVDIPFRRYSRSMCEVVRNRAEKSMFFSPQFFLRGGPPNFGPSFNIAPISDYVAKFRGNRPRDRWDLALNKKEKGKKQQQNIIGPRLRYHAMTQQAALIMRGRMVYHHYIRKVRHWGWIRPKIWRQYYFLSLVWGWRTLSLRKRWLPYGNSRIGWRVINYLRQGQPRTLRFWLVGKSCLSRVRLSVRVQQRAAKPECACLCAEYLKSYERILMKFLGMVERDPENSMFDFVAIRVPFPCFAQILPPYYISYCIECHGNSLLLFVV